jgi:membrane-associated phospholipid phosphatase
MIPGTKGGGWALARLWRAARGGFLADWRGLPADVRRRYVRTLALGLASVLVLTGILSLIAKSWLAGHESGIESEMLRNVEGWRWPTFAKSIWLEEPGGSTLLIPLVLLATWTAARLGRSIEAVAIAASFLGAKPILFLGRVVFDRDRPDLIEGGIARPPTESFPSGHTLQAVCVWTVIAYLWMRSSGSALERALATVLCLAIVGTVAIARLRLGTHWPSDLVAGAVFGSAWAGVVIVALRRALEPADTGRR